MVHLIWVEWDIKKYKVISTKYKVPSLQGGGTFFDIKSYRKAGTFCYMGRMWQIPSIGGDTLCDDIDYFDLITGNNYSLNIQGCSLLTQTGFSLGFSEN